MGLYIALFSLWGSKFIVKREIKKFRGCTPDDLRGIEERLNKLNMDQLHTIRRLLNIRGGNYRKAGLINRVTAFLESPQDGHAVRVWFSGFLFNLIIEIEIVIAEMIISVKVLGIIVFNILLDLLQDHI